MSREIKLMPEKPAKYNCTKCPGYCCSYPLIAITKRDVERLGRHFGLDFETARAKFTKIDSEEKYHFGRICCFFDTDKRRCTIYEARPSTCRDYPGKSCGYYEFLKFERSQQGDQEIIAMT